MPLNCSDDDFTWERDTADDNKYFYTVHSELNAILNYRGSLEGSKIYVTLFLVMNVQRRLFKAA